MLFYFSNLSASCKPFLGDFDDQINTQASDYFAAFSVSIFLKLMNFNDLVGRRLLSAWLYRTQVHEAWADASSPSLATYFVNLELADSPVAQVLPCEVQVPDRYPSLGIELREWSDSPAIQRGPDGVEFSVVRLAEAIPFLPASIADLRLWDSLGEGPISAVDLVLSTGLTLTFRHIYPPMMLGIDVWPEGRK